MRSRLRHFWARHRTLFWTLHSLWAFATGIAVILLARERYGFVPFVVLFLILTWITTLVFGRGMSKGKDGGEEASTGAADASVPDLKTEATSYVTRTMYQETMFFLIPFYAYSTVVRSVNVVFMIVLVGLATASCLDLVFDRWLRSSATASMVFFATVSFAALNLLLPVLLPLDPTVGMRIAAVAAILSSVPLATRDSGWTRRSVVAVGVVGFVGLGVAFGFPRLVPPVPLRLERAVFSTDFERETMTPLVRFGDRTTVEEVAGSLYAMVEVFAPTLVPTDVSLEWRKDGTPLRTSRDIRITAHELGFRVWDAWRPESGTVEPGLYEVVLRTHRDRLFGIASIRVDP